MSIKANATIIAHGPHIKSTKHGCFAFLRTSPCWVMQCSVWTVAAVRAESWTLMSSRGWWLLLVPSPSWDPTTWSTSQRTSHRFMTVVGDYLNRLKECFIYVYIYLKVKWKWKPNISFLNFVLFNQTWRMVKSLGRWRAVTLLCSWWITSGNSTPSNQRTPSWLLLVCQVNENLLDRWLVCSSPRRGLKEIKQMSEGTNVAKMIYWLLI